LFEPASQDDPGAYSHKEGIGAPTDRPAAFDYASLDPALAADARAAIARIRARIRSARYEIGHDLIAIKSRMDHGTFGNWVAAELGITLRTAENYMNAAKFVEGKSEKISILPPSAIYALAAPSAPAAIVQEVLAAVDAGTVIPVNEIRQKLNTASDARRKLEAVKSAEQQNRERIALAVEAARRQEDQEEHEATETERNAKALCVARFLVARLSASGVAELLSLLDGTDWTEVHSALSDVVVGAEP
jgi:hypothetical protein